MKNPEEPVFDLGDWSRPDVSKDGDLLIVFATSIKHMEYPEGWTVVKVAWWRRLWFWLTSEYTFVWVREFEKGQQGR